MRPIAKWRAGASRSCWRQSRPQRLLKRSAFSVSQCKLHLSNTGSLLEFLVPLLVGHPPFQTGAGFANRLRIQSHRPTRWGSRRWKRKCDACRNYRASKREWSLSGYWDPCSTKLLYNPKIYKNGNVPSVPTFPREPYLLASYALTPFCLITNFFLDRCGTSLVELLV